MRSQAAKIFVSHSPYRAGGVETAVRSGALEGMSFSVKDIFDVEGVPTGFGSPSWMEDAKPAAKDSSVVQILKTNGGTMVGKTIMDEMAWSLTGENEWYGTPPNAKFPDLIPGGSSSGAAASVAAGMSRIALGSDTGGSVRVPAANCQLYGMRPTHNRIPLEGSRPLAPSLDTAGIIAADLPALTLSMNLLLPSDTRRDPPSEVNWLIDPATFSLLPPSSSLMLNTLISSRTSSVTNIDLGDLTRFVEVFKIVQSSEVWEQHGEWVRSKRPKFGEGIADRFQFAEELSEKEDVVKAAREEREALRERVSSLIGENGVVIIPPSATTPLLKSVDASWRANTLKLTAITSLTGHPQVVLPVGSNDNGPVAISFIGPHGSDEWLLKTVAQFDTAVPSSSS